MTFLKKAGLTRRRVTNIEKQLPPVEEVEKRMKEIQASLTGLQRKQILNSDETGLFYGEKPRNQYISPRLNTGN